MASSFGGSVKLTGESEYRKALSNITSQLNVVSSELVKVSTQYDRNDNSVEANAKRHEALSNKLDVQKQKVELLSKQLEDLKNSEDANESSINKVQTALNKAETEVIKTTKELDNLGNEAEDSGKQAEQSANGGYTVFKNVLANLTTDVIKNALSGLKDLGKAVVDVGKQAVSGYADFEQLEGGVKTLFGTETESVEEYAKSVGKSVKEVQGKYNALLEAQNIVFEDARNSYKTAGMSANEYMETVTSFSASLISSLDGDTVKAAKSSKQAITDMSDNANKMGTDISLIQNAYQGFAKQNYTMLDNLKLGYGGTKTEMERLLADAQKISGIKYDISNLSDVYEAIHVVQTEMGITGTTAKEASKTITGSIGAMASSWQNLLSGLADGNANLSDLITNVVDSAMTVAENIMPVIEQVATSITDVLPTLLNNIIEYLPQFLETGSSILTSLITGLQNNMSSIMTAVMQIINMIITTIVQNLPQIIQMGIQMIVSLIQGIAQSLPTLIPQIIEAVVLMVETLLDNIDLIIDAGIQLIMGLAEGLIKALPDLIDKIPEIIDKLIIAITDNLPKLLEMGVKLIVELSVGLIKAIPNIIKAIPKIVTSLLNGFANYISNMVSKGKEIIGWIKDGLVGAISKISDVGKNLVQGLWNGINNAKDWVLDKIKGFGKSILNGIKSFFGIHSPSRVFKDEIGSNLALGIGEGFTDEMGTVTDEIQKSLPTDFDLGTNVHLDNNLSGTSSSSVESLIPNLVDAFKEALDGMAFKIDGEKMGELIIDDVERVIYS